MNHSTESVLEVLRALRDSHAQWLLLRNTENMLPDRLKIGKDIDVLVKRSDLSRLSEYLVKQKFTLKTNPLKAHVSWYGVNQTLVFLSPQGILLEVASEISVKSTHRGILIPLDKHIQNSAWTNASIKILGDVATPMLSDEDLLVCLISRCIFDKHKFSAWQRLKILELLTRLDRVALENKLRLVFFKFAPILIELIDQSDFDSILKRYITFKDY